MLHYTSPLLHSLRLHTLLGILLCLPLVVCGQSDPLAPAALGGEERVLLQEIPSVYSASKYEQKVTEAPASVSIVTADEIKKHGYRTLADILRSIRGFYVTYDPITVTLECAASPALGITMPGCCCWWMGIASMKTSLTGS